MELEEILRFYGIDKKPSLKATLTEYVNNKVAAARIDEWSLIGETLHSANIAAELHISMVRKDRLAELSNTASTTTTTGSPNVTYKINGAKDD